jgi:hypothetical protein
MNDKEQNYNKEQNIGNQAKEVKLDKKLMVYLVATGILVLVILIVLYFVFLGRNNLTQTNGVMETKQLNIPVGESMKVTDGKIISSGDIIIDGELIYNPTEDGDKTLEIISETGDIVLAGTVRMQTPQKTALNYIWTKFIGVVKAQNLADNVDSVERDAVSGAIVYKSLNGNITIRPSANLITTEGAEGDDVVLQSLPELNRSGKSIFYGNSGDFGGRMFFEARNGQLKILLTHASIGIKPSFHAGNGGDAGSVLVVDDNFSDILPSNIIIVGGLGGGSGSFLVTEGTPFSYYWQSPDDQPNVIRGPLDLNSNDIEATLGWKIEDAINFTGGNGGSGGAAYWEIATDRAYKNVSSIEMIGGDGGGGQMIGGVGGDGSFISGKVFNHKDHSFLEATSIITRGGIGGYVNYGFLAIKNARGGDGGTAVAVGNNGVNNSMKGGDVRVYHGSGGNASGGDGENSRLFIRGRGGNGAPQSAPEFTTASGFGGNGENGCEEEIDKTGTGGGDGGDIVELVAGDGGDGWIGGNGGNLYLHSLGDGGNGGNGLPQGVGGEGGALISSATGGAGEGVFESGRSGREVGLITVGGKAGSLGKECDNPDGPELDLVPIKKPDGLLEELVSSGNWLWRQSSAGGTTEHRSFYGECNAQAGSERCYEIRKRVIRPPLSASDEALIAPSTPDPTETRTNTPEGQVLIDTWYNAGSALPAVVRHGLFGLTQCIDGVFSIITDGYKKGGATITCLNCGRANDGNADPFRIQINACDEEAFRLNKSQPEIPPEGGIPNS